MDWEVRIIVCEGVDSKFISRVFVLYITVVLKKRLGFERYIIKVFWGNYVLGTKLIAHN